MTRLALSLTALVVVLFVAALVVGPADIEVFQSLKALFTGDEGPMTLVMREIRLPRALLAVVIGGSLGLAGAAMQGYLRNPLADPGLIGVSGSAALGAVLAIQTGMAASFTFGLPLAALAGALIGVFLVLILAGPRGSSLTLILAGIAISALAGAFTSLVLNLSPNPFAANEIVFWMMGSLADRSMTHVWIALPLIVLGALLLATLARGLDALTLGEDAAEAMGIGLRRMRLTLIFGTAAVVGASTAVAGAIGFVGLVVPHLLRPLVGAQPGRLLWASAFGGAAMLLAADIAVRVILPARDLKLGVVTALVGAPLFLHLIYRTRRVGL
ncbi:iron ABC transporter permease [Sulfitobacter sp. M57]|uniref:FecCD family ABC transporter permease n=1 Tax=unclassified Sulfitobacter TaxID=196795 RepID=UPI0023E21411|nr:MULTISPECIES: iron ABC transporter permease [unclassified Sulfitobacter]MDF3414539.1 iron ABC transporter permease [Sulfitobacter sp. KE5]MDF3422020.1 iron ABC transporter permease [Sulfitobacter sp. KE43]MDF3433085.1 iron ABC transporter permease [Sulfitobacter sp. KE42]MDF3458725.1 iron ABC transporter permease [Sulfitobacter sp. S74]MDF3462625.1 iron ABC transporter permease [Sulfitobacter sp. Ks18]